MKLNEDLNTTSFKNWKMPNSLATSLVLPLTRYISVGYLALSTGSVIVQRGRRPTLKLYKAS